MELVRYSDGDLWLIEELECAPETMSELGGPLARDQLRALHQKRLAGVAAGEWYFKIVPEPGGEPAGTIGVWPATWRGEKVHETGWMVRSAFQGRGIASQALELIISMARHEGQVTALYAFPSVTNAPSNALCRKFAFELIEETDFDYRDSRLRVNVWVLALAGGAR